MTNASGLPPALVELEVADEPGAWAAAGFLVEANVVRLGGVTVRLTGRGDGSRCGIVSWTLAGIALAGVDLDGLPTDLASNPATPTTAEPLAHPNGVIGLDHVVVLTPDLQRTIDAVEATGLPLRRIRDTESRGAPMRQAFFRLGPVILEVVSGDTGSGLAAADAPARWFGLALDVADLDDTKALLGDGLGEPRPAVQAGRRIATLRHHVLGLSVAMAAMDHHADR
jgi:catechol 2,3-dioxygenase-like lactoylglutathione lyase family enzyme